MGDVEGEGVRGRACGCRRVRVRVRCCLLNCTRVETEIRLAFSGRDPFYIFCAFFFSAIPTHCQKCIRLHNDGYPEKKRHKICQMGLFLPRGGRTWLNFTN